MNKKYALVVYELETDSGWQWAAEFPDVKGCGGSGNTAEEAVKEAYSNLEYQLKQLEELGLPVPKPLYRKETAYSGKYAVRMSPSLHEDMAILAQQQGISQNAFIVEAIAEKVGKMKK